MDVPFQLLVNGKVQLPARFDEVGEVLGIKVQPKADSSRMGERLWPSSISLATELNSRWLAPGLSVADLGCGLGLVGMLLAQRGCVVTLIDADACLQVPLCRSLQENKSPASVVCAAFADVRTAFDCVVGSDILYDTVQQRSIPEFLQRNWTKRGPAIFMDPIRSNVNLFLTTLGTCGFRADTWPVRGRFADLEWVVTAIEVRGCAA
jgi:2-polyprenyl-3-methyl-5-hydroxy-6-metoxy-1,4-benzoquinol methylase